MTDDERAVLARMAEVGEEYCLNFAAFEPLPRDRARTACRSLAASGLARFHRGLFTEDGLTAGSGYGATHAGLSMARAIEAMSWDPFCECRQYPRDSIWIDPRQQMLAAKAGAQE